MTSLLTRHGGIWLLMAFAFTASADDIAVTHVSGHVERDLYFVDASVRIELSPDARDALESGVPLQFAFDFEVHRPRRFMWNRRLLVLRRPSRLERHALANKYVVTDLVTHQRRVHTSIDDALDSLGQLTEVTLGKSSELLAEPALRGRMRAQLDIEALPAPLRPIAYLSPSWRLKSRWKNWSITR